MQSKHDDDKGDDKDGSDVTVHFCCLKLLQVLLQCGDVWLTATWDHRHVCSGSAEKETEWFTDPAEPRNPEWRPHYQLRPAVLASPTTLRLGEQIQLQIKLFGWQQTWCRQDKSLFKSSPTEISSFYIVHHILSFLFGICYVNICPFCWSCLREYVLNCLFCLPKE